MRLSSAMRTRRRNAGVTARPSWGAGRDREVPSEGWSRGGGRGDQRPSKPKREAGARLACAADLAVHEFDQALADHEAESGAAKAARRGGIGLDELLEKLSLHLRRNTDTRIGDFDAEKACGGRSGIGRSHRPRCRWGRAEIIGPAGRDAGRYGMGSQMAAAAIGARAASSGSIRRTSVSS